MALKFSEPIDDWRLMRQYIAERHPGWPLEYVDSLTMRDVQDMLAFWDGKAKAEK